MRLTALFVLALVAGCLEPAEEGVGGEEEGPIEFRTLAEGQQGAVQEETQRVITTQEEWEAFWDELTRGEEPAPEVDFSRETVVAATLGQRANACWAVRVTDVRAAEGATVAEVTVFEPSPAVACAAVVTYPFHVVAVEGADREVTFAQQRATYPPG